MKTRQCQSSYVDHVLYFFWWKIWEVEKIAKAINYEIEKKRAPNMRIIFLYVALCCAIMLFSLFSKLSHGFCGISLSSTRRTPNLLTCSTALKKSVKHKVELRHTLKIKPAQKLGDHHLCTSVLFPAFGRISVTDTKTG